MRGECWLFIDMCNDELGTFAPLETMNYGRLNFLTAIRALVLLEIMDEVNFALLTFLFHPICWYRLTVYVSSARRSVQRLSLLVYAI